MAIKRKILHISKEKTLEEKLIIKGFSYKHFNYMPFYDLDDLIEMWQRIFALCVQYRPHVILLEFEHKDCINDRELAELEKIAVTLNIYGKNNPA